MRRKVLILIIALMGLAFGALIILQLKYINESYQLKAQLFDQSVQASLVEVVKKTEKEEVISFVRTKISDKKNKHVDTSGKNKIQHQKNEQKVLKTMLKKQQDQLLEVQKKQQKPKVNNNTHVWLNPIPPGVNHLDTIAIPPFNLPDLNFDYEFSEIRSSTIYDSFMNGVLVSTPKPIHIRIDSSGRTIIMKSEYSTHTVSPNKPGQQTGLPQKRYKIVVPMPNAAPPVPPSPPVPGDFLKEFLIETEDSKNKEKVFEEIVTEMQIMRLPLSKRVKPDLIDSLIKLELALRNIHIPYALKVLNAQNDSFYFTNTSYEFHSEDLYQVALFEEKPNPEKAIIQVYFPDKEIFLKRGMSPAFASSGLLLLVMLGCFAYTLYAIFKQKRISEMKNDFINNMTHEFKTPASTILLASEALKDPQIRKDEERMHRLATIIYDENLRMSEHVERVLNMARLEKGELKLNCTVVNVHEVLSCVTGQMRLQLEHKRNKLELSRNANNVNVYADEMHLKNVFSNLIDNANKYSPEDSIIHIYTSDDAKSIYIGFKDEGIGMSKDQLKKIFKAFYRIPTGNLHDVKGFGLGLHYVYTMIQFFKGNIRVKSELGKGAEFIVSLPLHNKGQS